jgi:hypothetical protein
MGDPQIYPIWIYLLFFVVIGAGAAIALVGLFTNTFMRPHRQEWTQRLKKRPVE